MTDDKLDSTPSSASVKSAAISEPTEKVFVHQLNLNSADIRRREKEKKMVEEETEKARAQREIMKRQKEEERKRDMEMLRSFNPWGKPGAGAPPEDPKRKKHFQDVGANAEEAPIKFGQPGAGAPNRTRSGRIRTQLAGDPDIRFQDSQHVRLSIENHLRYKNADKENYRNQLDNMVEAKQQAKSQEKEMEKKTAEEMEKMYPFGRSRENGGSPLRNSEPLFLSTNPLQKKEETNEDFSPWGKGYGNPGRDEKGNVLRHPTVRSKEMGIPDPPPPEQDLGLALPLSERRGGNGEPHRTKSGNIKTRLKKTLDNTDQFGNVIAEEGKSQPSEDGYYPFGKPGAGAPFTREAGKSFLEKMVCSNEGWSAAEEKKMKDAKQEYLNTLKMEMEEKRQRDKLEREKLLETTSEFVDVMNEKVLGKPMKDPVTGEMKRVPRSTSDITSQKLDIRRTKSEMSSEYNSFLRGQLEQKQQIKQKEKEKEQAEAQEHQNKWDSFWGRPGNGAPRENNKKENLSNLLYGPQGGSEPYVKHYTTEVIPSKHKNHYEMSIKDSSNIVTKDYEFKTPYPAMT